MIVRVIAIGEPFGIDMNVANTKIIVTKKQPSPIEIMIDQRQPENVDCCSYLGSVIANVARCTCDMKYRISHDKIIIRQEEYYFDQQIGLKFK